MRGARGSPPCVMFSGVPGVPDSPPTSIDFGVDNVDRRKLHEPSSATGSNNIRIQTSRTSRVAVKYPRTQDRVCNVGYVLHQWANSMTEDPRQHTISTVTSKQRRIPTPSRRFLHQTTAPNPTTVINGEHARKALSGSSNDGANPAAKASILNNVVDHETGIAGKSI